MAAFWRPLSVRLGKKRPEFEAPAEGVPPHLKQPLADWLAKFYFFTGEYDLIHRGPGLNEETVKSTGVLLRVALDWRGGAAGAYESLLEQCWKNGDLFLDLVDLALHRLRNESGGEELNLLLLAGGSAYEVAPDGRSLATRVPEGVRTAIQNVIAPGDRAAQLLAESSRHIYGRRPSPGMGYREAVRAIEAIACPIVIPEDKVGTLGRVIGTLKATPGKFTAVLQGSGADAVATIRGMMEVIWKSQLDRHGTADEEVPLQVSQQEAEAALQFAVALVEWFRRGFIRRTK